MSPGVWLILALSFDFLNGFHDSANLAAKVIASRALPGRPALALVAAAIGDGWLARQALTLAVLLAALGAAILCAGHPLLDSLSVPVRLRNGLQRNNPIRNFASP